VRDAGAAPPGASDADPSRAPRGGRLARFAGRMGWITGLLLLATVVLVATHWAEGRALAGLARSAHPKWLVAGALLQLGTYVCAGAVWHRALARGDCPIRLASLVPLGLAKLFTDQAVPTVGLSGTLLVVRGLERRGVKRPAAVLAMLSGLVAYYLGYFVAIVASVAVFAIHGDLHPAILVPAAAIGLVCAGVPLAVLAFDWRRLPPSLHGLERLPGVGELMAALAAGKPASLLAPRLIAETVALQLAIFVLDALTLSAMLEAISAPVGFPLVFATFVMTSVATSLAWVPGGLGAFEASCVALLHLHGVPLEAALASTLLLRGFTFWLPMVPGFALARREAAGLARPMPRRGAP